MSEHFNGEDFVADFGLLGVIGLAAQEAMRRHDATIDNMRLNPELAQKAIATQVQLLDRFAKEYPSEAWNYATEAELREQFAQVTAERQGE